EGPVGLVAGSGGAVYLTEAFAGQVSKVEANGEKTVVAKDLKGPEGIALAPDGKLIVAEVGAKRIVQIDPANGTITEIATNLPIGLPATPGGLPHRGSLASHVGRSSSNQADWRRRRRGRRGQSALEQIGLGIAPDLKALQ